jgi:hypothetical protein
VEGHIGQCIVDIKDPELRTRAKVCLFVINIEMDTTIDEMTYLKYLRADLSDRGVKVMLVLINSSRREGQEWKDVEARISALHTEFEIKRDDIVCMEVYSFPEPTGANGKIILKQSQLPGLKV